MSAIDSPAPEELGARGKPRRVLSLGWHALLLTAVVFLLFPLTWAILTSFKPTNEIHSIAPIAQHPTLAHYEYALTEFPLARLLKNSTIMALGVAGGQVIIAVLASFALVHVAPQRRRLMTGILVVALVVPTQTLMIPQFLLASRLGWQNTHLGLIVPQLGASALAVILLTQAVSGLPASHVNAARLDGASNWQVLRYVILPSLRPAVASVFILMFISSWNEYLWPLLIAGRMEDTTVQLGLNMFMTAEGNHYGGLLAAAVLTALPIVAVYLVASRRITQAFLMSGAK